MKNLILIMLLLFSSNVYSQSIKDKNDKILIGVNEKGNILFCELVQEKQLQGHFEQKVYYYLWKKEKTILLFKNIQPVDMADWIIKNKFTIIKH